jgi:hypothetical protein
MTKSIKEKNIDVLTAPKLGTFAKVFIGVTILLLPLSLLEYGGLGILKYHMKLLPKESFYWLFSSIAQSMAAMFGIGGLFAAHIFQRADTRIRAAFDEAKKAYGVTEFSMPSDDDFLKELSASVDNPKDPVWNSELELDECKIARDNIVGRKAFKSLISVVFKDVTITMTLVIVLPLVALPFSNVLAELTFGNIFTLFLILLVIMSTLRMIRFVLTAVLV